MYVLTHMYTQTVHTHTYMLTHTENAHTHICTHNTHIHTCTDIHIHMYTHLHTHVPHVTHIHAQNPHTYTHIHTFIPTCASRLTKRQVYPVFHTPEQGAETPGSGSDAVWSGEPWSVHCDHKLSVLAAGPAVMTLKGRMRAEDAGTSQRAWLQCWCGWT